MNFMPMRAKLGKTWMMGMQLEFPYFPCPNTLVGIDEIQNCGSVIFFTHRVEIHQVSLNGIWRWLATHHRSMLGPLIDEPLISLDL